MFTTRLFVATLVVVFALVFVSPPLWGQQEQAPGAGQPPAAGEAQKAPDASKIPRRVESFAWNPVKDQLTWVISSGEKAADGTYKPLKFESYAINMAKATMRFGLDSQDGRRFSKEEAVRVYMGLLSLTYYTVESTVWWEDGQGTPVVTDKDGNPVPDASPPASPPLPQKEKVRQPAPPDGSLSVAAVTNGAAKRF